jgi:hypothetical protein
LIATRGGANLVRRPSGFRTVFFSIIAIVFFGVTSSFGQRIARKNINDPTAFSHAEVAQLHEYLSEWIEINEWMIAFHGGEMFGLIHSNNVSLPWHRAHLREIESFLLKKSDGWKYVPLPGWLPDNDFNLLEIREPFDLDYEGEPFDFTHQQDFDFQPEDFQPSNICDMGSTHAAFFTNWVATHNAGHSIMGGDFNSSINAGLPLFWLYHAALDDFWYLWEKHCPCNYDIYPTSHTDPEIIIDDLVVWDSDKRVKGVIRIVDGGELRIEDCTISFRESAYESYPTRIIVESGGRLEISEATLKGIYRIPSSWFVHTSWDGIVLQAGAEFWCDDAHIEEATTALRINGNAAVSAIENCTFRNNRKSITVRNRTNPLTISGCTFIGSTELLKDNTWYAEINTSTPTIFEVHFDHCKTHVAEAGIELFHCKKVDVTNCSFLQSILDPHSNNQTRGIFSSDTHLSVGNCQFHDIWTGIMTFNSGEGPRGVVRIKGNEFDDCKYGVHAVNQDYLMVEENEFNMEDPVVSVFDEDEGEYDCPETIHGHVRHAEQSAIGVRLSSGASSYRIHGNVFTSFNQELRSMGVLAGPTRPLYAHLIDNNEFLGLSRSVQVGGTHQYFQMPCNTFFYPNEPGEVFRIGVDEEGVIPNQGSDRFPTGNSIGGSNCQGEVQFYHANTSEMIEYYYFNEPGHEIECKTANVSPFASSDQSNDVTEYCAKIQRCFLVPFRACYYLELESIKQERDVLIANPLTDTTEQQNRLQWYQVQMGQVILEAVHRGVDSSLFSEVGLFLDSAATLLTEVGADAALWEHRISSSTPMLLDTLFHSLTFDAQLPGAGVSRLVDLWYGAGNVPAYEVAALVPAPPPAPPPAPMYAGDIMWMKDFADKNAVLLVYPNPFKDEITISSQHPNIEVMLFDLYGQVVRVFTVTKETDKSIYVGDLVPGIYFMKYNGFDGNAVSGHLKLIKP